MTNPNFGGTPFAAGSLFGYRAFNLGGDGILISPTFGQPFLSAENQAQCLAFAAGWFPMASTKGAPQPFQARYDDPEPESHVGAMGCSCGFYAYVKGRNEYHHAGRVAAIIEGYGRCTYGDRGFRTSKAKLVAMVKPNMEQDEYREMEVTTASGKVIYRYEPKGLGNPQAWEIAEKHYDVPIYDTLMEAIEAHPVSQLGQEKEDVQ